MDLVATTARGLEEVLTREVQALGGTAVEAGLASVRFSGERDLLYRSNLWLRTANRILVPLASFLARTPEELYAGVRAIPWEDHLDLKRTFAVHASTRLSRLHHSNFVALKTKDAVADRFRDLKGARPDVDRDDPDLHVLVRILSDRVEVALDASGESLHRRGYRGDPSEAPLKETLAAGLVLLSEWTPDRPLLDPMCGSGTILTEAALLGRNRAPGLGRRFGFMRWPSYDPGLFRRLDAEAHEATIDRPLRLHGSDRSPEAVARARRNARQAGVEGDLRLETADLASVEPPGGGGVVVTNPPYGERMGKDADLEALYRSLGDTWKRRFRGWTAYLFTGNLALARHVGLRPARRWILWNGAIECRLLKFPLY